jgi:transposase-like protein
MPGGRPPHRLQHIERLEGSWNSKRRLKAIVATLSGEQTIVEACRDLGIGPSRFHAMRCEALQAALERIEPHAPGRKPSRTEPDASQLAALSERVAALETELILARARAEVAEVLPGWGRRRRGS